MACNVMARQTGPQQGATGVMRTLGIDLAAAPRKTARCDVRWEAGAAVVEELFVGQDDGELLEAIRAADKAGIDAPFGWPDEFVVALAAHRDGAPWPGRGVEPAAHRRALAYRATDRHVEAVRRPLSVSTDRIGVTAMRCAHLLDRLAEQGRPVDRLGGGGVCEVYPAAALVRWGFDADRYKLARGRAALGRLCAALREQAPWLRLTAAQAALAERVDDAFDALVAALVARAAAIGLTDPPPGDLRERGRREGWIHLPVAGSLARLPEPQD